MVKKCRAAILEKIGEPLVVRELDLPDLHENHVLVKVLFSGVCRSQLMEVDGGRGVDPWLPHLLGHEGSGIVVDIGSNVKKVQVGDEVILGWLKGEGLDAPGAKYFYKEQVVNSGKVTTFSNYTIVSESRVFKKPNGMAMDAAVLYGCALPTGAGMVFNQARPRAGDTVAILGLGGVGYSSLLAVKSLGVEKIIAIDISNEKLDFAKSLGASHCLNSCDSEFISSFFEIVKDGVDICIESAGSIETIELGFSLIRFNGGRLYFASHPADGGYVRLNPHDMIRGKIISGSWGGGSNPDKDIFKIFNDFKNANINMSGMIAKRYSLNSINLALSDLREGKVFRPLIVMDH
jgi:S-(hydroxymethyl)glutathione dehydrogenase/alcohol dehydrogenase